MLFEKQVAMKNDELRKSDQQIDRLFKTSASQTLARLYHESFHAYLHNFVYPPQKYDVPPWLNEGLAMIFEGGMLEGSTLRVDAPNALALRKLKADLVGPDPLPLTALLAAGKGQFLEMADARPAAVDRYYAHAWGLAVLPDFPEAALGQPRVGNLSPGDVAAVLPRGPLRKADRRAGGQVRPTVAGLYPRSAEMKLS